MVKTSNIILISRVKHLLAKNEASLTNISKKLKISKEYAGELLTEILHEKIGEKEPEIIPQIEIKPEKIIDMSYFPGSNIFDLIDYE